LGRYCGWVERVKESNNTTCNIFNVSKHVIKILENNISWFPGGCCEESSIILNRLLKENKIYDFKLIRGSDKNNHHHFWLQNKKFIIDLTAHQFDDIDEPIIMLKKEQYHLSNIYFNQIEDFTNNSRWDYLNNLFYTVKMDFYKNNQTLT